MIPPFNEHGLMPHDSVASPEELRLSHLVTGDGVESPNWDTVRRGKLVYHLTQVFDLFSIVGGITEFWLNGSFVEAVDRPGDIDVYFTLRDPRVWLTLADRLNALEGEEIWTWDVAKRRMYPGSVTPKPPFWGRYSVDIYPDLGRQSGIFNENGDPMTFPEAFRQQRTTHRQKGIVRLRRNP